jgi:CHAD domain-containing protein
LETSDVAELMSDWRLFVRKLKEFSAKDDSLPRDAIHPFAGELIYSIYRELAIMKDSHGVKNYSKGELFHDLRKRSKELRYSLELFGSTHPRTIVESLIDQLKELQDKLGYAQDRRVQVELIKKLRKSYSDSDIRRTLKRCKKYLHREKLLSRREASELLTRFFDEDNTRLVHDTFT